MCFDFGLEKDFFMFLNPVGKLVFLCLCTPNIIETRETTEESLCGLTVLDNTLYCNYSFTSGMIN